MADMQEPSYSTATISNSLRENASRYVERVTGSRSWGHFFWQGTVLTLLSWMPTVLGSVVRGLAYRTVLEGVGPGCFIEKDVRWQVPRRIRFPPKFITRINPHYLVFCWISYNFPLRRWIDLI